MIDEPTKEKLRTLTVETMLELRRAYLGTPGVNALKHWDQLQDRARAAARTCASPEEWVSKMARDLQLPAFNATASDSAVTLVHVVTERGARNEWLDLMEDELGYLLALCRLESERRKEASEKAPEKHSRRVRQSKTEALLDHGN